MLIRDSADSRDTKVRMWRAIRADHKRENRQYTNQVKWVPFGWRVNVVGRGQSVDRHRKDDKREDQRSTDNSSVDAGAAAWPPLEVGDAQAVSIGRDNQP